MIAEHEIDKLKASNPAREVAARFGGLEFNRQGLALCPFHAERTPSFHVKDGRFYCFGCGWAGDIIDYVQQQVGVDFAEACRLLGAEEETCPISDEERQKRRQEARERRRAREAEEEAERAQKRKHWPEFHPGDGIVLSALAELRGVSFTACRLAQLSGALTFCRWRGLVCWAIGDGKTCVQLRRLDGQPFDFGDKPPKAWTLPGSKLKPIGLTRHRIPAIIIEGGPDYLACWELLHRQHREASFQPVCMLGTSARLNGHAEWLRGREVLILADADTAGRKAAAAWKEEAETGGASKVTIGSLPEGTDLNDFVRA